MVIMAAAAILGVVAVSLSGGLTGPLAILCLTPLAAALVLDDRRLALGVILSMLVGVVVLLLQLGGAPLPELRDEFKPPFALAGLAVAALTLAGGLILSRKRTLAGAARIEADAARQAAVLAAHPYLFLSLHPHGKLRASHGVALPGVDGRLLARQGLSEVAVDRHRVSEALRLALAEGVAEVGFAPVGAPDRWVIAVLRRTRDSQLVAVLRDATPERAREAALDEARVDAESMAAGKSRFLADMSHELRTPLNAIMGFSDIMRASLFGPLPAKYSEYGQLIHEAGSHLLDLINDVLDMSKIEADRFELSREPFDAREAVSAALRLVRVQADSLGIQLRGVLSSTPVEIDADRRALKQIVLNLVSNALKFTPRGGSITVTANGFDGIFELVVADTGVGISPEDLERLGRPYEQAGDASHRAMGTGLGLSLVRSMAELHGGEMVIESTVGEGASVTVRMPVLLPPSLIQEPPSGAAAETATPPGNVVAFTPLQR